MYMPDFGQKITKSGVTVTFDIRESNVKHLSQVFTRLGNEAYLRILLLLAKQDSTIERTYQSMKKARLHVYRESTYKALEKLREIGLIGKSYDPERKTFVYFLAKS